MTLAARERTVVWMLAISALLCVNSLLLEKSVLATLYRECGFYIIFFTVIYWVFALLPRSYSSQNVREWVRQEGWVIGLILLLAGAMFQVSPPQFRVLADETNLLGVANSMFYRQGLENLTDSLNYFHQQHVVNFTWDIRPNFFPFLVNIAHTVLGYSAYNGFIVNFLAGVASLWSLYWLLGRWFERSIALLGMLVLAAFPVFVLWVTSSGFEVVNLAMALLAFCLFYRYLERRDGENLERLLITLVLLAQTRYESMVILLAIAVVVAVGFQARQLASLPWRLWVIPWLLLPVVWQRLIKTDKTDYQVYGGEQHMFSLENLERNSTLAWSYFTGSEQWYGTIGLVFYLALAGLLWGIFVLFRQRRSIPDETVHIALAGVLGFLALFGVVFSYYWGNLTLPFTIRLGIIFLPFLIVSACFFVSRLVMLYSKKDRGSTRYPMGLAIVAGFSLCLYFWPVAAKNEAVNQLTLSRQYASVLAYLEQDFGNRNNLIVTDRPGMYSVHEWGAVNMDYANRNGQQIINNWKRRLYQDVIFIQIVSYETGLPINGTAVSDVFSMETRFETQFDAMAKLRISKLIDSMEPTSPPDQK